MAACPCTYANCGGRHCQTPPKGRYACHTKACGNDDLTSDEMWVCHDCCLYFCDEHISDVGSSDQAIHVCAPCGMIRAAQQPGPVRWENNQPNDSDRDHAA
jgi:hypothetical protein